LPGKPNKSRRSLIVLVAVILAVLGLDLATKEWARSVLSGSPIPILPGFFTLAYVENTGIALGLFQTQGRLLTFLSPLALLVLAGALGRYVYQAGRYSAACVCGLIIGGAAGNVWSRLTDGYVVYFLDFYIGTCHWPTFNAADTALCCGVAGFLWLSHLADRSGRIPLKNQESSHDNASR